MIFIQCGEFNKRFVIWRLIDYFLYTSFQIVLKTSKTFLSFRKKPSAKSERWKKTREAKDNKKRRVKRVNLKKQSKCRLSKGDSLYYGETSSVLLPISHLFFIASIRPKAFTWRTLHSLLWMIFLRDFNLSLSKTSKTVPEAILSLSFFKCELNCQTEKNSITLLLLMETIKSA